MCVTSVTCELRVCGLRCRSGSSLYIYRVYFRARLWFISMKSFIAASYFATRTPSMDAMAAAPEAPRIVDFSAVVAVINALPHAQVIEAIAAGFVSYSRGQVSVPQIQTLGGMSRAGLHRATAPS